MRYIPIEEGNRWQSKPTGDFAIVDDLDFARISQHRWFFSTKKYAKRSERRNGKFKMIYMAQEVMGMPAEKQIDHENGNKLDNRRSNLRICTNAENSRNRKIGTRKYTSYKGISRTKERRWSVVVGKDYKAYRFGNFADAHMAALVYDFWATSLHGEFVKTNFKVVSQWTNPKA